MTEQAIAEEKTKILAAAVRHVLGQIKDRPEVRYLMGYGSESFDRLTMAWAAHTGASREEVEEKVLGVNHTEQVRVIRKERLQQILTERGLTREMQLQLLDLLGFDIGDEAV